jgi:glyceraldehyde 3-phosphate dehydrogenase
MRSDPTSTARSPRAIITPQGASRASASVRRSGRASNPADLTVEAERGTSAEEVNAAFRLRADSGPMTGILAYNEDPIVSSDIVKSPYSSIYDAPLTSVMNETQVKIVAWYDNEWGYATRLVELAALVMVPVADLPANAQVAGVA